MIIFMRDSSRKIDVLTIHKTPNSPNHAPAQNAMYAITLYKPTCNDILFHVHVKT